MAVPRIFCLRGQTSQTFTGISRIQTGFLVKHYVRIKKVFLAGATAPPPPAPRYVRPCSTARLPGSATISIHMERLEISDKQL